MVTMDLIGIWRRSRAAPPRLGADFGNVRPALRPLRLELGLQAPEVGEGRTARQPGQVRKEAALTRQGGSLSNLPPSPSLSPWPLTEPFERRCPEPHGKPSAFRAPAASVTIAVGRAVRARRSSGQGPCPRRTAMSDALFPADAPGRGRTPPRRLALSGARAQIPPAALRGPDRPGADGPHARQFLRRRAASIRPISSPASAAPARRPPPASSPARSTIACRARSTGRASTCRSSASTARRSWIRATST